MPTFELTKRVDEIQEPELLPEDWYLLRITREPRKEPNKAKREGGPDAEGAGDNLVLDMRVQHEDPAKNGRPFTKYLRWPQEGDDEEFIGGQTKEDFLTQQIAQVASAFVGYDVEADQVEFEAGMEAQFYIVQGVDNRDGVTPRNEISMNIPPKEAD